MSVREMISEVIAAFDQEYFSVSEPRFYKDFAGECFSFGAVHEFVESLMRQSTSIRLVAILG